MTVRTALNRCSFALAAGATLAAGLLWQTTPAAAEGPFGGLNGAWTGSGQIRLAGGSSEALKCRAYYTPKDGTNLGLAIRCASASNKIELRANLIAQGGKVTGSWEERTFNASGAVTGQVSGQRITLSIVGGGFTGAMSVATSGGNQTVSITTDGIGLKGVSINLSKG